MESLQGCDPGILLEKTLEAIERGISPADLRHDPFKYLVSGQTKEVVINTGGEGLKISREILREMAKRGDVNAQYLIERGEFESIGKSDRDKWLFLEQHGRYTDYDRENPILIQILKEGKLHNIGGWSLEVYRVHAEQWTYKILKGNDLWASEYIVGHIVDKSQGP